MTKKKNPFTNLKTRVRAYLKRRPHRSFRLTRRRDYSRSLKLPKYWQFTFYVNRVLWKNRKIFLLVGLFYAVLTILLVGLASQNTYTTLSGALASTSQGILDDTWGKIGGAGLLLASALTGGMSTNLSESQQVYAGLITLLTWLTTVWLLRNLLAGQKVKLRDGIYNSGAPIVSTFLVSLVIFVQLIPMALALIGIGAATASGLLSGGVEAMLFCIVIGLLFVISIYFVIGTLLALVIVTLPGMYPMRAIKISGDLVIGRRVRILLRLLWMAFIELLTWALIMIPIILLDNWLAGIWAFVKNVPVVPVFMLLLSTLTIVWTASYIYLLYRKVVDDETEPA